MSVLNPSDGKRRNVIDIGQLGLRANMLDCKGKCNGFANNAPHALRPTC